MAASTEQKLDYLLKKIGYTASKTGLAEDSSLSGTKKAPFAEAIPSPLVTPSTTIWNESALIPTTPPGSDTAQVRVYLAGTSGHRMTVDSTVSGSRAFIAYSTYNDTSSGILGDWIDPQFGDAYIIKVYKGDPNSGGTLLSAAGAGSNDTWFFDYSSGVLNFNGTVIPSGVTDTNIYIVGYRYIGVKGLATSGIDTGGTSTFTNLDVTGVTTFTDNINPNGNIVGDSATNIIGIDNISASGISSASAFADFDYLQAPFGSTTTFTVTVSSKDATHRYNGQGSGNAYLINGVQSPILTLTPGRTYRFTNDNTGSHPLKFYYEADRTTLYTTGVNFQNTYTEITISDTTPNVLHYQCTNHGLMGNAIITNSNVIDSPYAATLRNSLTVTNNINANGNIIGDSATNISGINSISALGLHVDGDVSIGGTLTYEDVTNIDSVGLITARTGVRINTGGLIVTSGISTLSHVSVNAGVVTFTNVSNPTPSDSLPAGAGGHIYSYDNGLRLVGGTGGIRFHSAGFQRWQIDSGGSFTPFTNNLVNIGGSSNRVRRFYGGNLDVSGISTISNTVVGGATTELFVTGDARVTGELKVGDGTIILNDTGISTFPTGVNIGAVSISTVTESSFPFDVKVGSAITFFSGAGIVSATSYRGDGSKLTGIVTSTGINTEGTSTFQNITVSGNINANGNIVGDNSTNITGIAGVTATTLSGTLQTAAQPNVTSLGTLTALTVSGAIDANGDLDVDGHTNLDNVIIAGVTTAVTILASGYMTVDGNINITTGKLRIPDTIEHYGDSDTKIRFPSLDTITFETAGSERLRIASDGVDITGIATATDFSGNISGVGATFTNITGTLQTAAQTNITSVGTLSALTVSGNINANGNIVGDNATNISGINSVTATNFFGNISGVGATFTNITGTLQTAAQPNVTSLGTLSSLNVTGDVSIGGTLTYEDVTNIDSVGIITARTGIKVLAGGINAVGVVTGTNGLSGTILTAAQTNITSVGTLGSLTVSGNINANGNIVGDNATNISGINSVTATKFFGNGEGLTNVGVDTATVNADSIDTGTLNVTGISTFSANAGPTTISPGLVTINPQGATHAQLTINSTESNATAGPVINLVRDDGAPQDNDFLGIIKFNGSNSAGQQIDYVKLSGKILDVTDTTEDAALEIKHYKAGSETVTSEFRSDGLYLLNNSFLNVTGISTLTGNVSVGSSLLITTNKKAIFGPEGTLEINSTFASGSGGSYFKTNAGPLVMGPHDSFVVTDKTFSQYFLEARNDAVDLWSNGVKKFSTTGIGASVLGQLEVNNGINVTSGVSTFAGITTVTGETLFSKQLNVSGVSTFSSNSNAINANSNTSNAAINIQLSGTTKGSLIPASDGLEIGVNANNNLSMHLNNSGNNTSDFIVKSSGSELFKIDSGTIESTFTSTDAGSSAGPVINLYRNSASPADADYLGQIKFQGESDTGVQRNYAKITGKILDASNGTEDGIIEFAHIKAGSQTITGRFRSDSLQLLNSTNFSVDGNSTFTGTAEFDGNAEFDGFVSSNNSAVTVKGPEFLQINNDAQRLRLKGTGTAGAVESITLQLNTNAEGASTQHALVANENSSVKIYHSGSQKLETTSTGVVVTGIVTATSFSGDGSNLTNVGFTTSVGTFNASSGVANIDSFAHATEDYKVAEYTLHFTNGSDIQAQKLLVMQDGSTAYSQEFAVMSSGSQLVSLDAIISGANVLVRATPETGVSGTTTFRWRRIVQE